MQLISILVFILLKSLALQADTSIDEVSSMSIEEMDMELSEYERSINENEEMLKRLEKDRKKYIKQINIEESELQMQQLHKLEELTLISNLYRSELHSLEPMLCLPEHTLTGTQERTIANETFDVNCGGDASAGPGWTVIQRRVDNEVSFEQNHYGYVHGFGNRNGSFFIGLQKLYLLTSSKPHELYISLENWMGETRSARYSHFMIDEDYQLISLGSFSGDAGDALNESEGQRFRFCETKWTQCGWWLGHGYKDLGSNLNALTSQWITWKESFKTVQMMIRPQLEINITNSNQSCNGFWSCLFHKKK